MDSDCAEIRGRFEKAEDDRSKQILVARYIPTVPCYMCSKNAQCIAEKRWFCGGWWVTKTE
jgi:hypothetical protein